MDGWRYCYLLKTKRIVGCLGDEDLDTTAPDGYWLTMRTMIMINRYLLSSLLSQVSRVPVLLQRVPLSDHFNMGMVADLSLNCCVGDAVILNLNGTICVAAGVRSVVSVG